MIILNNLEDLPEFDFQTVVTLGNFDGIHLGHRHIINSCVFQAKKINGKSVVVTYDHQNSALYHSDRDFIYLNHEKIKILENVGVDYLVLIPFSDEVKNITARKFLFEIIKKQLNAAIIIIGYDHHFGKNREGNIGYLKKYEEVLNYRVIQIEPVIYDNKIISSSRIRNEIATGDFKAANEMLGYPYHITGKVMRGFGRGKITGFPTANIKIPFRKLIPSEGVYIANIEYNNKKYKSLVNIGKNPTFNNENLSIEAHILNFSENLYDKNLTVFFAAKIRNEKKFSSVEELHQQIENDIKFANEYYGNFEKPVF
jgi:riboflavin kinase/FMN adenylyltransferase